MSFLNKIRTSILQKVNILSTWRNYGSALFIPGNKADATFSFLSPYLDFDKRFLDLEKFEKDLTLRGLKVDISEMKEGFELYKHIYNNRQTLEHRRIEIRVKIEDLRSKSTLTQEDEKEIETLLTQVKVIKEELKTIKEAIWEIEDSVVGKFLKLPNEIDERTPEKDSVILKIVGEIINPSDRKCHLDVGKNLGILEYINPMQYYFLNEAVLFELGALSLCGEILGEDMIRVAGSDFGRSVVVEGSCLDHEDPSESFILADKEGKKKNSSRLHLVGNASFISFLAMHTKQLINPKHFPVKFYATGKQYTPFSKMSTASGLFSVCQSSSATAFTMVKESESEEYKVEFENLLQKVIKIYDNLGIHYRIVIRSAPELQPWESHRVSFELWSAFNQQYVEVGFISSCGDFISKRLLIAYQTNTGRDFPAIISGTVLSVPRLIACILEQNPQKFDSPMCSKKYMQN